MNKAEMTTEIERLNKELERSNAENETLKKNLHSATTQNEANKMHIERLEEDVKELFLDFSNPHGSADKVMDFAMGTRIENMVAFVNHLSTTVHEKLVKNVNRQRESLIINQRALDTLGSCAAITAKQ